MLLLLLLCYLPCIASWVKEMENTNLFEGDMILRPDQMQRWSQGVVYGSKRDKNELWPNGVVPYIIARDLRNEPKAMQGIKEAFAEYKKYTCIRFVQRTNQQHYVEFHKGGGCSSWVGRSVNVRGGRHPISLDAGCWWRTTIMHEIGHSLGFYHEQSRPDRDSYIEVLFNNMPKSAASQFQKQPSSNVHSQGTSYDYESMMHYNSNAFGHYRKGADFALQTIRTLDPSKQWLLGQRDGFSKIDVIQINKLYSCPGTYPSPPSMPTLPTNDCHDKGGSCSEGKTKGQCTERQWQSWMNKACRFTCGFCQGRPNTGGPVPTGGPIVTNKPPVVTDRPPPTGNCDNKDRQCVSWAQNGWCTNSQEQQYIKDNCCKACKEFGVCPQDRHSRCQEWANRGECKVNPTYMLKNCKRACKWCI